LRAAFSAVGRAGRRTRIGGDDAKKETEMKPTLKIALAFVALSSALAITAHARDGGGRQGGKDRAGMMPPLEMLDADKNGDVTLEEFTKVANERFAKADIDKDGKLTVAEVAAEIEKMRAEQMAKRMIARFDANDDGVLTTEESANGQKKMFAMLDKNDDGKIVQSERPGKWGRHGKGGDRGMEDGPN
jgi:Ca2+-binding EF-hand superfamily protein